MPAVTYLTEGGQETELMYKHGHELAEFAMYPLLDDRRAVADLTAPRQDRRTRGVEFFVGGLIAFRISANAGERERFTSRSPTDRRRRGRSSEFDSVENELQPESELLVDRNACELVGRSNGGGVGVWVEGTVEVAQLRRVL
jgi:hypothetical protein